MIFQQAWNKNFYELFGTPDKIKAYVKYTKFVRENGDKVTVKLCPDIDAIHGETDAWININIYELSILYNFKVTRDATLPLGRIFSQNYIKFRSDGKSV